MDVLAALYPWIKSLHLMAVMSWMAGLFYLPRVFVYHAERSIVGDQADGIFKVMEDKLLRVIMTPAMIVTWLCGLLLAMMPGIIDFTQFWPWLKLVSVLVMTWFHVWLMKRQQEFFSGQNERTGRHYRIMNEVPTVLMVVIVISVIVRFA